MPDPLLDDVAKLELVRRLMGEMTPEFKQALRDELDGPLDPHGEKLEMQVSHNEYIVRIDLNRRVRWFALPYDHAIMLAMLLLEHAGAKLERKDP